MQRIAVRLTPDQAQGLKRIAESEGKSVAELIRVSVDAMLRSEAIRFNDDLRMKAIAAAGMINGPENLAAYHDDFLEEVFGQ